MPEGDPHRTAGALPFSQYCIDCQRKSETDDTFQLDADSNWASAMEFERRSSDHELSLSDLDQAGAFPEY